MMENIAAFGKQDGCKNLLEVINRCDALDALKYSLESGNHFLSQKQLNPHNFREKGGIGVIIDRNGNLIWFSDGAHRLGIARHLGIKKIPICIHKIHAEAILNGVWRRNLLLDEDVTQCSK